MISPLSFANVFQSDETGHVIKTLIKCSVARLVLAGDTAWEDPAADRLFFQVVKDPAEDPSLSPFIPPSPSEPRLPICTKIRLITDLAKSGIPVSFIGVFPNDVQGNEEKSVLNTLTSGVIHP
jgi:hypothetical protein